MDNCILTFRSKGSPLRFPSIIVNEWQVAMPISNKGGSNFTLQLTADGLRSCGRRVDNAWESFNGAKISNRGNYFIKRQIF